MEWWPVSNLSLPVSTLPVSNPLEEGRSILLVNPQHMRAVPGRKTDVKACSMARRPGTRHGLLTASCLPPTPIRQLRELTRYRKTLVQERAQEANRLQQVLESATRKLAAARTRRWSRAYKAVVAVAHAVLVVIYHLLRDRQPYRDLGAQYFDQLDAARLQHHHVRRLEQLGYAVTLTPSTVA